VVLMYSSLGCTADDLADENNMNLNNAYNHKPEKGLSACEQWEYAEKMLQVKFPEKGELIKSLNIARDDYLRAENKLKTGQLGGIGVDGAKELFFKTVRLRNKSFGAIAKVLTKVLMIGENEGEVERHSNNMAYVTRALGVVDGVMDAKEDLQQGTVTEAIAGDILDLNLMRTKNVTNFTYLNRLIGKIVK
jgi:hypothetical protein